MDAINVLEILKLYYVGKHVKLWCWIPNDGYEPNCEYLHYFEGIESSKYSNGNVELVLVKDVQYEYIDIHYWYSITFDGKEGFEYLIKLRED